MSDASSRTVLTIDDEQIDQEQFRRTLVRSGMADDIVPFFHADEALDWLRHTCDAPVDLVLLDLNMPRMTGLEFLALADDQLCAMGAVVAVMLTTPLLPDDLARVRSFQSVAAVFDKPLNRRHLDEAARLLAARRN